MKLFCQTAGQAGDCTVLLHGLFGASSNLMPVARGLEGQYRCLLPDLRNHGRSAHSNAMNYQLMAADLDQLLKDADIDQVSLVGHSMGGKVAMQFALDFPRRVKSLVVVDIAPVRYSSHHQKVLAALSQVAESAPGSRRAAQAILSEALGEPAVVAFLMTNWLRRSDGGYGWRFNLPALLARYDDIAAAPEGDQYVGPTLFIKGELSDYIVADHRQQILRLFPAARLKVMAGCGHWLHAEKPAIFTRLVRDFIYQNR